MRNKSHRPVVAAKPSEDDVRDYAYHVYTQGNCVPGQDLAHWFEATAFLSAMAPPRRNGVHHNPPIMEPDRRKLSLDS